MDGTERDSPMDWEAFYREGDWKRGAYLAGHEVMAELADRFLDRTNPESVADVGCGPASVLFDLAKRHPDVEFVGFDAATNVVAANREQATAEEIENLRFGVDALPDLDTQEQFDVVYCIAVLYFVRDVRRALQALYDRVRPGGHLVLNYPNLYTHYATRSFEGEKREAFSLVAERENLLTYDDVREILDAHPRSYWTLTDGREHARRRWPVVVLEK